ncbi:MULTISPECIES: ATP-binding cassette domain-containing protein [Bacillus cereus group]|uniref:ATP-binding cassette domain-containing protein n=1 Tax=Bacillus cereus group TaxID=86661 RepID=UPI001CFD0A9C|nr:MULTISPECIES: ABC transporter ATP-binding protein [Bacillus cereus group]USK97365.1 ABC transporter ATP-binding protein [Bacillus tropicus]WHT85043.1 ABC transporter ATP-binding protein [Bacillus cereus]WHT90182.1 ABC transporter ATP-binding protein [Bacillus cereus]
MLITIENLNKSFKTKQLLKDFSFEFKKGENIFITGKNGAGKTTLINMILGFEKLDKGTISINIDKHDIGMVFQKTDRDQYLTVENELEISKILHSNSKIDDYVDFLNIEDLQRRSSKLSGGEWQKLQVIKAISFKPKILITDEISTGLDYLSRESLYELLKKYLTNNDTTYISVSHYADEINLFADKVLVMNNGEVEVYDNRNKDFTF